MSDTQITDADLQTVAVRIMTPFIIIFALKWIILIGLNRLARSIK